MPVVRIDCARIRDQASLHDVFHQAFGFPAFYGRNMDAWIDCMTYLDSPNSGMTSIHCAPPGVVTLLLEDVDRLPEDLYGLIQSCAALVNWRRVELGEPPVLAVACDRSIR